MDIKSAFEAGCPGLTLQVVMDPNYYGSEKQQGVLYSNAAVHEVDSVFYYDAIRHGEARPLSTGVVAAAGPLVPYALLAARAAGKTYGIPHWLCSDFLFYRKDHPELAAISSPDDAHRLLTSQDPSKRLIMDIKGRSTLGELYLSILVQRYGVSLGLERAKQPELDPYALSVLEEYMHAESAGFGRDEDYHGRTGFYGRQFARDAGAAFVGYSEESYFVLDEIANSCKHTECLKATDFDVAPWPFSDNKRGPAVSWVDMYMISSQVAGQTLSDAVAFVKFMMMPSTYKMLLVPKEAEPPRYLLPARDDLFADREVLRMAPNYPKFREIISQATAPSAIGLNDVLRDRGKQLDKVLAVSR